MATGAATTAETMAAGTRVYWCTCGWSGSGLPAMQEHLDRHDDGSDAHEELA